MMTTAQAAYRAGCIVSEIEYQVAGEKGLSPACLGNCSRMPGKIAIYLRHLWAKAVKVKSVADLLDGWEDPNVPASTPDQGSFWIGYYHQKTARELPLTFGAKLAALREAAGLSPADLAKAVEMRRASIYELEAGKSKPTWDTVQRLAAALGVTTDSFKE